MTANRSVIIKRLPERVGQHQAQTLIREVEPFFKGDHPYLVFDFSDVCHLDSAGIEILLQCVEEALKRNGDLKFAAVPPAIATILKLTRVDCLFEMFDNASDAVESFYRFPVYPFQQTSEGMYPSTRAVNDDPRATLSERPEER